jgi:hypothetical protein
MYYHGTNFVSNDCIIYFHVLFIIHITRIGNVESLRNHIVTMKNTYCLFQIKFITEYTNVQQVIITQILLKYFN